MISCSEKFIRYYTVIRVANQHNIMHSEYHTVVLRAEYHTVLYDRELKC